jgi:hypothetical protein
MLCLLNAEQLLASLEYLLTIKLKHTSYEVHKNEGIHMLLSPCDFNVVSMWFIKHLFNEQNS